MSGPLGKGLAMIGGSIGGLVLAEAVAMSLGAPAYNVHRRTSDIRSFDTPKPLTKRQKRRLRGKESTQ